MLKKIKNWSVCGYHKIKAQSSGLICSLNYKTEALKISSLLVWMGWRVSLMRLILFILKHRQLCIVHMVRNSLKFLPWKYYKTITADLKRIYQSITEDEALLSLDRFEQRWDNKYPSISRSWRSNWQTSARYFTALMIYAKRFIALIRLSHWTKSFVRRLKSVNYFRMIIRLKKLFT